MEDYRGGNFSIPDEDEVVAPEQPGWRDRPRQEHIHEDPSLIPIDEEFPMDWYNVGSRQSHDDLGRGMN